MSWLIVGLSGNVTSVTPDTTAPAISAIDDGTPGQTTAAITWTTDESSDSQVEYGLTGSYGSSTTLDTTMVTSHSVGLAGLTAGTLYHYRVKSRDAAGNLATSADQTLTTAAAGGFVPTDIAGLAFWYESDALVLSDSDPIPTWADASGLSRDLSRTDPTQQPTYLTAGGPNGKPRVNYDGTNDFMFTAAGFTWVQPATLFIVARLNANADGATFLDQEGGNLMRMYLSWNGVTATLNLYAGAVLSFGAFTPGTYNILEAVFNGASSKVTVNGVADVTGDAGGGSGGSKKLVLGAFGAIGGAPTPPATTGDYAATIGYDGALSAPDRASVRVYLKAKYGTP